MEEISARLKNQRVGIAGCGGLGSNCAAALVRAGLGRLVIADFDVVSETNLNRQFYFRDQIGQKKVTALAANLRRINPQLEIDAHDIRLDPDTVVRLFSGCPVIVEAFDLAAMKQMIIEAVLERLPESRIISGMGLAGYGGNEALRTERLGRLFICGDQASEVTPELPPLAPRVGIVAHMQANLALELLLPPAPRFPGDPS